MNATGVAALGCSRGDTIPVIMRLAFERSLDATLAAIAMVVFATLAATAGQAGPAKRHDRNPQQAAAGQEEVVHALLIARDRKGQPVTDLSKEELQIYEGKLQRDVVALSRDVEAPLVVALMIDTSGSASRSSNCAKLRSIPAGIIADLLREQDLGLVATFSLRGRLLIDFTDDRRALDDALHEAFRTIPGGPTAVFDAIGWACDTRLVKRAGHRAVIVISDMVDNQSDHSLAEVTKSVQSAGVVIYPIVPVVMGRRADLAANHFAVDSGGIVFPVADPQHLAAAFRAIKADLANLYTMDYKSNAQLRRGKMPPLSVQCTRNGVKVFVERIVTAPND